MGMPTAMLFDVTYTTAFVAGLLSFFSPCVLPLIPSYFCFITGLSLDQLTTAHRSAVRSKIILSTLAFVSGFSVVFIIMGASASLLGTVLKDHQAWVRIIGGLLMILFGLHLTGLLRIPLFEYEKRLQFNRKPLHFLGTFLIGMAFGAGWTPCIGPILGSVLVLAQNKETVGQGAWLLSIYSAGLALPFMVLSVGINYLLVIVRKTNKILRFVNPAAGILLIATGLLLVTNKLVLLSWY
jgi:cytochrome c-type biogenesis protein